MYVEMGDSVWKEVFGIQQVLVQLPLGMGQDFSMPSYMDNPTHSMMWVRPTDFDGDGLSVEEDCDDTNALIVDDCDQDGFLTEEDCDDSNADIGGNFLDCDEDGVPKERGL